VIHEIKNNSPIGVFDSGVGGLTVFKEIRKALPNEDIIYLGDTARVPYGTKSQEVVIKYSVQNVNFLLEKNVKAIVVACNTASAASLPYLQEAFPQVNIVGVIDPVVDHIKLNMVKTEKIAVIGTNTAISSGAYQKALTSMPGIKIFSKACPLFVPLVEEGMFEHEITYSVIDMYLNDIKKEKIDAIILGCTHYPMLKNAIKKYLGNEVEVLDTAYYTALDIARILSRNKMYKQVPEKAKNEFYVTDSVVTFKKTAESFLDFSINNIFHI
jgi:glutamate racemase